MRSHKKMTDALLIMAVLVLVGALEAHAGQATQPFGGSYRNLSPAELQAMLERKDFPLINVHIPYEGELAATDAFIPFDTIEQQLQRLPPHKDAKIILYCMSGRMSEIAAEKLVHRGYTNVSHLQGGMLAWRKAGYPLKGFKATP